MPLWAVWLFVDRLQTSDIAEKKCFWNRGWAGEFDKWIICGNTVHVANALVAGEFAQTRALMWDEYHG